MSILNNVPQILRAPLGENAETIISSVVPNYLKDLSIEEAIGFVKGAIRHQHRVVIDKSGNPLPADKNNSFKATISDVEIIERRGEGNFLYGKKARIHMKAKGTKGTEESQTIDTEWVEYNGWDKSSETFSIALARTLRDIAESNIGKEVIVRKGFITGVTTSQGGDAVRFCADIIVPHSSKSGSSENKKVKGKSRNLDDFFDDIMDDRDASVVLKDLKSDDKRLEEVAEIVFFGMGEDDPCSYIAKNVGSLLDKVGLDVKLDKSRLQKAVDNGDDLEVFITVGEEIV